jgi:hypothetical protein
MRADHSARRAIFRHQICKLIGERAKSRRPGYWTLRRHPVENRGCRKIVECSVGDLVAKMRELRKYFARSYEPQNKLAARVGVTQSTVSGWPMQPLCSSGWQKSSEGCPFFLTKQRSIAIDRRRLRTENGLSSVDLESRFYAVL